MLGELSHPSDRLRDASCTRSDVSDECSTLTHHTSHDSRDSWMQRSPPCGEIEDYARNFDCNVCMRACCDPVVTWCGHLFCWPCLYYWLSLHPDCRECPVCRADVQDKILPLYGCGRAGSSTDRLHGIHIPCRPSAIAQRPIHAIQHNEVYSGPSAHLGFCALLRRLGLTSSSAQNGGMIGRYVERAATLLMRRRRFNNEKEFMAHWLFIVAASAASALLLAS